MPGKPLEGIVVAIDAGHDGGNANAASAIARPIFIGTQTRACDATGTQTASGYTEHEYTLDVAFRLRDDLVAEGARVVMTRETDSGVGPALINVPRSETGRARRLLSRFTPMGDQRRVAGSTSMFRP